SLGSRRLCRGGRGRGGSSRRGERGAALGALALDGIANFGEQQFFLGRTGRCSLFLLFLALERIDALDHEEQNEGDDDELDHRVDEKPDIERGNASGAGGSQRRDGNVV